MSSAAKIQNRAEMEALVRAGQSLTGVDAGGVDLTGIDLSGQDISGAKLRYTDLSRANLQGANLAGANLRHARLLQADLRYADLTGADCSHADLHGAILGETRMTGLKVEGIIGVGTEVFFPLTLLESLLKRPNVVLGEEELTIPGDGVERYRVVQAYRIVDTEGGDVGDPKLLGKVLSLKQIRERGGEVAGKSVIVGDFAYRCEEGYIGVPIAGKVKAAGQVAKQEEDASDMDLLKDFLLSKLQ